ncbi:hypothetical protein KKD61_01670 [Patescibacteria group bacterium]|nr:hypothetical protein [Patescibacteria group bacterium]
MTERDVSLLPRTALQGTILGKLVNWILSTGRYIVVFTELIVIGAFLSRFWLDRKDSDLSEEIRQRQAIISSINDFEEEFRLFQSRLSSVDRFLKKDIQPLSPLDLIVESLPPDILVSNYSFSENIEGQEVSLSTTISSESSLAAFVDRLLAKETINKVRIGTVEREQGIAGMKVQFLISFKEGDDA